MTTATPFVCLLEQSGVFSDAITILNNTDRFFCMDTELHSQNEPWSSLHRNPLYIGGFAFKHHCVRCSHDHPVSHNSLLSRIRHLLMNSAPGGEIQDGGPRQKRIDHLHGFRLTISLTFTVIFAATSLTPKWPRKLCSGILCDAMGLFPHRHTFRLKRKCPHPTISAIQSRDIKDLSGGWLDHSLNNQDADWLVTGDQVDDHVSLE